MNIALWIVAGLLALAFLGAGTMKVSRSKEQLTASGMGWTEDFSTGMVKTIGSLELLGALGLILPAVTGILPVLVPIAALGLTATMIGAVVVHLRRPGCRAARPGRLRRHRTLPGAVRRLSGTQGRFFSCRMERREPSPRPNSGTKRTVPPYHFLARPPGCWLEA